jgi:hypothetical protein
MLKKVYGRSDKLVNKVLIECDELINKFELSKEGIIKQLK